MFEHVTHFRYVYDILPLMRVRLDLFPQVSYIDVEILFFVGIFRTPYLMQQVAVAQGLPGFRRQFTKKFIFLATQPDFLTLNRYQPPMIVDTKVAGSDFG